MFETERFIIRPYTTKDAENLLSTIGTYEVYMTTYGIPHPCNLKYARKWIKGVINNAVKDKSYEYAIIGKQDGQYLGNVGLINIDMVSRKCDISYFVNPEFWGCGIATEAASELIGYAFNVMNINRVGGSCMEHNIASARVMEKLSMKYEGTMRDYFIKNNRYVNLRCYSILQDEFKALFKGKPVLRLHEI